MSRHCNNCQYSVDDCDMFCRHCTAFKCLLCLDTNIYHRIPMINMAQHLLEHELKSRQGELELLSAVDKDEKQDTSFIENQSTSSYHKESHETKVISPSRDHHVDDNVDNVKNVGDNMMTHDPSGTPEAST